MSTKETKPDGRLASIYEGMRPLVRGAFMVGYMTVGPLSFLPNKNITIIPSEDPEHQKKVHENLLTVVLLGLLRTTLSGAIAVSTNDPLAFGAISYCSLDTLLTSLRRVGYGRIHNLYNTKNDQEI